MTTTVRINGAGQSGPVAALALAKAGYDVTVCEHRTEAELGSYGVIGITPENVRRLGELGADLNQVELDNSFSEWNGGNIVTSKWGGSYVMWSDLHNLTMSAAREAGAQFRFGADSPQTEADITVQATGVTSASRELNWDYSGYMVYRGLSKLDTNYAWLAYDDPDKRFAFKLAHSPLGASWEMYAHRELPAGLRTMTASLPGDLPAEAKYLPGQFQEVINATRKLQIAPISDWEQRSMIRGENQFSVGDANGAMRPHTGMGANLGIREALALPGMLAAGSPLRTRGLARHPRGWPYPAAAETAAKILADRKFQHDRGIRMGRALLGS